MYYEVNWATGQAGQLNSAQCRHLWVIWSCIKEALKSYRKMDYCTLSSPKSLLLELSRFPPAEERPWKPRQNKSPTFFMTCGQETAIRMGGDTVTSYWRTIIKVSIVLPYLKTWFSQLMRLVIFTVCCYLFNGKQLYMADHLIDLYWREAPHLRKILIYMWPYGVISAVFWEEERTLLWKQPSL